MPIALTTEEFLGIRVDANRLGSEPVLGAPAEVARARRGLQSQDPAAANLGVRPRSAGLRDADVDHARDVDHTVVQTWTLRGTLHLHAAADVPWLLALLGPTAVARAARRREQLGLNDETYGRALRCLRDAIADRGVATREEIRARLAEQGIDAPGQFLAHLLHRAACEGHTCAGPGRAPRQTYALLDDWIDERESLPRDAALERLAQRFLEAYAPARPTDLGAWSGLPVALVREAWRAVGGRLVEVALPGEGEPHWMLRSQAESIAPRTTSPSVRLLPRFDTYMLGHRSRALIDRHGRWKEVNAGGGILHPVVLLDGVLAGAWRARRGRGRVTITIEPFTPQLRDLSGVIAAEVADVGRFLDVEATLDPVEWASAAGVARESPATTPS